MAISQKKRKTGSALTRKVLQDMYDYIFQQDGAPAHNTNKHKNGENRT